MTMDIYQRTVRPDSSPPVVIDGFREHSPNNMHSPVSRKPQKPVKRSFDVAFLMAPDNLCKKREEKSDAKKPYQYSQPTDTNAIIRNNIESQCQLNPLSLTIHPEKISADISLEHESKESLFLVRSAFTKVNNSTLDSIPRTPPVAISPSSMSSTTSNRSGTSPDLTYQDSLSPQPFIPARSPVQLLNKQYNPMSSSTLPYFVSNSMIKEQKHDERPKFSVDFLENEKKKYTTVNAKQNFPYHSEHMSMPYSGFPMSTFPFPASLPTGTTSVPIFPAANLTAALLPTSLAALTLPAQNVCAKCNMHFRMTSDLVYHMRSHHKNENSVVDPYKRRRDQDKLKCPVCNESFRERHHLTRHMTAHQDKEDEESNKEFVDVTTLQRPISSSSTK